LFESVQLRMIGPLSPAQLPVRFVAGLQIGVGVGQASIEMPDWAVQP